MCIAGNLDWVIIHSIHVLTNILPKALSVICLITQKSKSLCATTNLQVNSPLPLLFPFLLPRCYSQSWEIIYFSKSKTIEKMQAITGIRIPSSNRQICYSMQAWSGRTDITSNLEMWNLRPPVYQDIYVLLIHINIWEILPYKIISNCVTEIWGLPNWSGQMAYRFLKIRIDMIATNISENLNPLADSPWKRNILIEREIDFLESRKEKPKKHCFLMSSLFSQDALWFTNQHIYS